MVRARPLIVVAGPTGSGKSSLAIFIAEALGGEIISCDSVQVYRGFDIGSAKTSVAERRGIVHHLIDCCDGHEQYHAARFRDDALRLIGEINERDRLPVIAGGTTLYLSALLSGLSEFPDSDSEIRERLQSLDADTLYKMLKECDPKRAGALHPNDSLRVIRALEIFQQTGKPMSSLGSRISEVKFPYPTIILNISVVPEVLRAQIEHRTRMMLEKGLAEEVQILKTRYGSNAPALSTVGYFEVGEYLAGRLRESELAEKIVAATSRLAKRQRTFWRNEPEKRGWKVLPGSAEDFQARIVEVDDRRANSRGKGRQKGFVSYLFNQRELIVALKNKCNKEFAGIEVWHVSLD